MKNIIKTSLLVFALLNLTYLTFSQKVDSTKSIHHFSGSASITNNGISLVPSFSLAKPAVVFLLSFGGNRFSIDPDIRFGLDGKPWTFLFWARYKLITQGRLRLNTGVHLGLNFRTSLLPVNSVPTESIVVRRYLAGELAPNYFITKNISIGTYYLYARGVDNGTIRNGHFLTINANFSHLPISQSFYLRLNPQVFYLYQDGKEGYYGTALLALANNNFPLSVSYLINKKFRSDIAGKDFISSLSLIYSFRRNYVPKSPVL